MRERQRCRLKKDYRGADSVREELRSRGVECIDKYNKWKHADGREGVLPSFDDVSQDWLGAAQMGSRSWGRPVRRWEDTLCQFAWANKGRDLVQSFLQRTASRGRLGRMGSLRSAGET